MKDDIKYISSFVAFFDILGFSSLIQESEDLVVAIDTISRLSDSLASARAKIESRWSWEKDKLDVSMFSDCVCISIPARIENIDAFFQILALVQSNFVRQKLCIRGGVAIGKHFANDHLIFSEGLIKAYTIESKVAEFPRIVVPHEFWSFVVSNGYDEDIIWFKDMYIWSDPVDGLMIVDYLNFMPYDRHSEPNHNGRDLKNHKSFIEESLNTFASDTSLLSKYQWMAEYHNSWCKEQYPDHPELLLKLRASNKKTLKQYLEHQE